jgi:hypothetical protein
MGRGNRTDARYPLVSRAFRIRMAPFSRPCDMRRIRDPCTTDRVMVLDKYH